jgi:predicted nucleotidyltransferase
MKSSEALATHRVELRKLVSSHNFMHPHVFGSVLAGTDTEDSDLDLLVDRGQNTTLFALARLEHQAGEMLGVRVSVLTPKFLPMKFRDKVLRQAQPL